MGFICRTCGRQRAGSPPQGQEYCAGCPPTSTSAEYKAGLRDAAKKCRQFAAETMSPEALRAYENAASAIEAMLLDEIAAGLTAEQLAAIHEIATKPQSDRQRQEQALSFAWGNLGSSTNHQPSKDVFRKVAFDRYGWNDGDFDAWWERRTGTRTS